jgi:hypothetical protein
MRTVQRVAVGVLVVAGAAVTLGVSTSKAHHHSLASHATPAPAFTSLAGASRAEIMTYARSLSFDTSHHAVDTRRLVGPNGEIGGPIATIAPEIGSATLSEAAITRGRIVGRVSTTGAEDIFGFAKGDNYLWVDKVDGRFRMIVIPADSTIPWKTSALSAVYRPMTFSGSDVGARFIWRDNGSTAAMPQGVWVRCGEACCAGDGLISPKR